jgi:predicted permease
MEQSSSAKWHRYLRFWRNNVSADVDDEIAFHVDARTNELIDAGLDRTEARRRALAEFGDVEQARTVLRSMDEQHETQAHRNELFIDLWQDVRIATRSLARSPGFVAVITLTLALGIGLNAAVYSLVDAYLFRPKAVANGKDLVVLAQTDAALAAPHELSYLNYKDYRADTLIFRSLTAYMINNINVSGGRGADRVWVEETTANYFTTLGVKPMLGRVWQPGDDDGELAHPYVVLTYRFWQSHFGGSAAVIGDTIRLNNHPATIIGVTPPEFHGADALLDMDAFTLLNQTWPAYGSSLRDRGSSMLNVIGLLRPGLSLAAARQAVNAKAATLERQYPEANRNVAVKLVPETHARPNIAVSTNVPMIAMAFMLLVLAVLAIACANVASLLLARASAQFKEQAIRAALGASRWRLARRVIIECLLLATAGGIGALALAQAAVRSLATIRIASDVPLRWAIGVDARVMTYTLVVIVMTALIAATAPVMALRRANLTDALKSGGRGSSGGHQRIRSFLVVAQLAVCVIIVVCAALFARSAANASKINVGFKMDHVLMATAQLGIQGYDSVQGKQFERDIQSRVAELPGVRAVALSRYTPFGYNNDIEFVLPEVASAPVPENGIGCFNNIVTPTYFGTMSLPIVAGRGFDAHDDERGPKVAVVTQAFARRIWPGQSALGKRFRVAKDGPLLEIVGLTGDIQYFSIGEAPKPFFFRPYAQWYRSSFTLDIRTAGDPTSLINPVRALIKAMDPTLPVFDVRSMEDHIRNGRALLGVRVGAWFAAVFGGLALLLASVGLYGLISYSVEQRTREIGIRVALGARTTAVLRLVLRQGMTIATIGVVVGLGLTMVVTQLLASILYGVAPHDPVILVTVAVTLGGVAMLASLVPARRATRVDPVTALRAD